MTLDGSLRRLLAERVADPDPLRAPAAANLLSAHPETTREALVAPLRHPVLGRIATVTSI